MGSDKFQMFRQGLHVSKPRLQAARFLTGRDLQLFVARRNRLKAGLQSFRR
jgi:hypothetical protein